MSNPGTPRFTASQRSPVLNFTACDLIGTSDWAAALLILPVGRIHGPRDRRNQVDLERLHAQYALLRTLIETSGELAK